uniref:N-acetyltransferase domain-containing protein n=1 Tax=Salvator merianae TaxID=96440 RepID=A0A8D0BNR2_SALMN
MSGSCPLNRFRVRPAEPRDCSAILRLIKVRGRGKGKVSECQSNTYLLRDGFGSRPFFYCLVAEASKQDVMGGTDVVGFAMYYFTYDPWIGKLLYLEDFYVMDEYRGKHISISSQLIANCLCLFLQIAIDSNCSCMHFLVVVWNKPSIEYYMRRGASDLSTEEGWHLFRFDKEHLIRMASGE